MSKRFQEIFRAVLDEQEWSSRMDLVHHLDAGHDERHMSICRGSLYAVSRMRKCSDFDALAAMFEAQAVEMERMMGTEYFPGLISHGTDPAHRRSCLSLLWHLGQSFAMAEAVGNVIKSTRAKYG
jgi:hypothetical protein